MKFRDYQLAIIDKGVDVLLEHGFLYLAMEVRTGKTLTALGILDQTMSVNNVLFITKKKAISSIVSDFSMLNASYEMVCTNYESLHKLDPNEKFDAVICDEAHCMGAFPKPSKRSKQVRDIVMKNNCFVLLLSGTPTPESYSQMYHQVYGIPTNPFKGYKNFYRFSDDYVRVTSKKINGYNINDYSRGKQEILNAMNPYTISYSQKEAGFSSEIEEEILHVKMSDLTYYMCKKLKKDFVIEGKEEVILAETGVKLMSKLHQMYSGTVKFDSGQSQVLDTSKAEFIKKKFNNKKIGIFYKFKAELDALKKVFGDSLCTDLDTFDSTDKNIALQIVSGREGISLKNAEHIVFYNIDFSATSYWQARDRMTTKDRMYNKIYWIFSEGGIESQIYKAVVKKKDYTLKHFKKDLLSLF